MTLIRRLTALASAVAVVMLAFAACEDGNTAGDRGLIPTAGATPISTANSVAPEPTAAPTQVNGVTVYAEIPPMAVNISEWRETDFRRFTVDPDEIISGGAGRNDISPIYEPEFMSILQAATLDWMTGEQPVAVVEVNDEARAYPLGILTFHEVVNDVIGGEPVVITYCPLCYTALAFSRVVDGVELNFGTTGNVRLSNLIMWDDQTESWWQQADGQAIVGAAAGQRLAFRPAYITSFRDYARAYPDGQVLSPLSGAPDYWEVYGNSQYVGYDSPNNPPVFFLGQPDDRLGPTERILGVEIGDSVIAYPFSLLRREGVVNTEIDGEPVVVFWKSGTRSALDEEVIADSHDPGSAAAFSRRVDGRLLRFEAEGDVFRDAETGSLWTLLGVAIDGPLAGTRLETVNAENGLWFAWAAFRPTTEIYTGQ